MPNTLHAIGVSNPNVPIFPPRVCTLVLFIAIVGIILPYSAKFSRRIIFAFFADAWHASNLDRKLSSAKF